MVKAVIPVESAGDTIADNPSEEAAGDFRIRPVRLPDYFQRTCSNYKIEDCYDYDSSKEIFLHYARQTGYRDYERTTRRWNGSGKSTIDYWEKVKPDM